MDNENEVRIHFLTYLKHIFIKPTANILNNTYVFWMWSLFVLLIATPLMTIGGLLLRVETVLEALTGQHDDYGALIYLVEFFLLYFLVYVIIFGLPLLMFNMLIIYFFNKAFSRRPSSFQKVLSDFTNVWTQSYVLFYLGSVSFLAGAHLHSSLLHGAALFLYVLCGVTFILGSIVMMQFYFRHAHKLKFTLLYVVSFLIFAAVYVFIILQFFL